MESENETRPLLHDFESETWRSKARKRCLRIPSEVAITGIILGLFFVVVTLLIVLENMEDTKESEISVDKSLLASPFKYNKKAEDMSWQDKKDSFKPKKKQSDQKWDNANKGFKKFPDISGKIENRWNDGFKKNGIDNVNTLGIPAVVEGYGKEVEDSWEELISLEQKDPDLFKNVFEDTTEIVSLLQSPNLQWDKIDAEWKRLTKQGWKDKELRDAFVKVLQEKEEELKGNDGVLQSPMQLDQLWNKINDSWKKKIQEEQKDPDLFKNGFKDTTEIISLLQSPNVQWDEIDAEWKRLTKQGWKDKELRDTFVKALKEKEEELKKNDGVLQSPMKLDQLWNKINDSWKKKMQEGNKELEYQKMKGKKEVERQKTINDDWKNKMGLLQSPKADMKNIIKADDGWKRLSEQGWKISDIKRAIIEAWKEKEEDLSQSPMNLQNLWGKSTDTLKNNIQKGMDKQKSQKDINDDWANKFGGILQSPMSSIKKESFIDELLKKRTKYDPNDKSANKAGQQADNPQKVNYENFLEDIVEMIKEHQKDRETENFDKAGKEKEKIEYSSMNVEDFLKDIIDTIKERQKGNKEAEKQKTTNHEWKNMNVLSTSKNSDQKWKKVDDHWKALIEYERNSHFEKNDDHVTTDDGMQHTISFDNIKWDKTDSGWKKLTEQGWKDKDLKEAVYKAWKDGDKLLQSAMGYNNMKWKKVNDGWKKISNKS